MLKTREQNVKKYKKGTEYLDLINLLANIIDGIGEFIDVVHDKWRTRQVLNLIQRGIKEQLCLGNNKAVFGFSPYSGYSVGEFYVREHFARNYKTILPVIKDKGYGVHYDTSTKILTIFIKEDNLNAVN